MTLCGFLGGAGLAGRLWGRSLPLEASVVLPVWVMAELVLEFQREPWAQPAPQAGSTGGFRGQILTMFYLGWRVALAKLVPTLCSVPAIFVLFAWLGLQRQFKTRAVWPKPWSRLCETLGMRIHRGKLPTNLSSSFCSQRAAISSAGWFREAKLSSFRESASRAAHCAVPISSAAPGPAAGPGPRVRSVPVESRGLQGLLC